MVKYYLKLALRHCWKDKVNLIINVLGLTIGLASCIILLLWVQKQFKYNDFLSGDSHVYQLITNNKINENIQSYRMASGPIIQAIQGQITGVEDLTFMRGWEEEDILSIDNNKKFQQKGRLLSANFFTVIQRPFLYGNPKTSLKNPLSIVISVSLAKKIFGNDWQKNINDKVLYINDWKELDITGVFEDFPENSTIQLDYGLPFKLNNNELPGNFNFETYIRLHPQVSIEGIQTEIERILKTKELQGSVILQAFDNIYLHSNFQNGKIIGGRIEYVQLFILISIFILLMACVNYSILYIARSSKRTVEIGVKKILGASQTWLIRQILIESIIFTILAAFLAIVIVFFTLPRINLTFNENLQLPFASLSFWGIIVGGTFLIGTIVGIYPASVISGLNPIHILKANQRNQFSGKVIRKGLFVFQFFISLILLIFTFVVKNQLSFLKEKDLGYTKENIIYKKLHSSEIKKLEIYRQQLEEHTSISNVTFASTDLQKSNPMTGDIDWPGKSPQDNTMFNLVTTDQNFLKTLDIPIYHGQGFPDRCSSGKISLVLNRQAANSMGGEQSILNKIVKVWNLEGQVIGIVDDFHFRNLFVPIEPLVLACWPDQADYLLARINPNGFNTAIDRLKTIHQQNNSDKTFEYHLLEDSFNQQFKNEHNIERLCSAFSILAIFITWLGVFGLSNFTLQRRAKELSLRKLMGGTFFSLFFLVAKDFLILISLALLLAVPVSIYGINQWLSKFEYVNSISNISILGPGVFLIFISLTAIFYHTSKTILMSPAKVLQEN